MSPKTISVGVIGAGANTKLLHIPKLQATKGVEVVAVANRTLQSSRKVAKYFGIPEIFENWEDIIFHDSIDAVCIGTWPYMHAPMTIAALEAGKHVLCEARMALNSGEASEMLEVSRMNPHLIAQIVPAPLSNKFDPTICQMISDGFIGDLITVDARITTGTFLQPDTTLHWRQDRNLSGNNIMNMGIWYEIIMRWLGPVTSVQALGQTIVKYRKDESGQRQACTIPDHVEILGEMAQGGQLRLSVSAVTGHMPMIDVHVCGTHGTLRLTDAGGELELFSGKPGAKKLKLVRVPKNKQNYWRVEEEFINAIRGKEIVTHTDLATGVQYMQWTDAVSTALRTGEKVKLPLDAVVQ
jgi:predicted dehydrogenase